MIACANAAGSTLILDGQRFNPEWSKGEVPYILYGKGEQTKNCFSTLLSIFLLPDQ